MANLLEALTQTAPATDTTSQLATLLRAKSGKAVEAPTTALSTQQEQAAQAQTAQAMQPVQQAAQIQQVSQEQQGREIEQKRKEQQANIAQDRRATSLQTQLKADELLQDLEQNLGKIGTARYRASLEQIGQNLRLNNREYVDNLQREGARARIDDKAQFEQQLNRAIFADNKMLLEKQLNGRSILAANNREFEIAMAKMGLDTAWEVFNNDLRASKDRQKIAAIGSVISGGVSAYGTYATDQQKKEYYTTGAGQKDTSFEAFQYGSPAARGKV